MILMAGSLSRLHLQVSTEPPAGCDLDRRRSAIVLGQCVIASNAVGTVGGLSGAYFENNTLWAVTDSRTQSHLLRFGLTLDPRRTVEPLAIESHPREVALRWDAALGGAPITQAEGMAPSRPNEFWAAAEATTPVLFRCDARTGICGAPVDLPPSFKDIETRRGIEGLASSPSGRLLVAALERPRPSSPEAENHWVRLAAFETGAADNRLKAIREYLYPLDWIPHDDPNEGIGVSDVLFIDEDDLLIMERGYFARCGNTIRLYRVRLDERSAVGAGGATPAPLKKTLVADLRDYAPQLTDLERFGILWRGKLRETLENFEALAWGPTLSDGARVLLLVSDDNFKRAGSTNQVTAVLALGWSALSNKGPVESSRIAALPRCDERR